MQELVANSVMKILSKAGFMVTDLVETKRRCFDIVARREDVILLLKVLYNVDSLKSEMAEEMKLVGKLLKASPIVVGERFTHDYLERGVVYNRHGLPVINTATFYDFIIEGEYPFVYSAPGGYYVKLDKDKIRQARERLDLSLGDVAKTLGISRRAVKKYEEGIDTTLENAIKLEEVLGVPVAKEINILEFVTDDIQMREVEFREVEFKDEEAEIIQQLKCAGIKIWPVRNAPFDVVSNVDKKSILTGIKQVRWIEKRANLIGKVSEVLSMTAAYIVDKKIKKDVDSVVFVMKEELELIEKPKDFFDLIQEKKEG